MENTLQIFESMEFGEIRTVMIDNEPWLVGKDVAMALGYTDTDQALRKHVDNEDKLTRQIDGLGQKRGMMVINESGLYALIISSKLPSAKRFKHWVTHDVLPSIRKTGSYNGQKSMTDDEIMSRALVLAHEKLALIERQNQALTETVANQVLQIEAKNNQIAEQENQITEQANQIAEMQPKASYYNTILGCPDVVPISVISKDYGMSARRMNALLHRLGIQFKQGDIWLLYQDYANEGYTQTRTYTVTDRNGVEHAKTHTYWTQKGRFFLYEFLGARGIRPTIEQNANA